MRSDGGRIQLGANFGHCVHRGLPSGVPAHAAGKRWEEEEGNGGVADARAKKKTHLHAQTTAANATQQAATVSQIRLQVVILRPRATRCVCARPRRARAGAPLRRPPAPSAHAPQRIAGRRPRCSPTAVRALRALQRPCSAGGGRQPSPCRQCALKPLRPPPCGHPDRAGRAGRLDRGLREPAASLLLQCSALPPPKHGRRVGTRAQRRALGAGGAETKVAVAAPPHARPPCGLCGGAAVSRGGGWRHGARPDR